MFAPMVLLALAALSVHARSTLMSSNFSINGGSNALHSNGPIFDVQRGWNPPPVAADDLWQKALCKGTNLVKGMSGSDNEAGQIFNPPRDSAKSEFNNFPQTLADWNYFWNPLQTYARDMDNTWGIATALRDLGIADKTEEDGGKLHTEYVTHGDPLAEDEEGPIEMHEQEYPEPGGNRRLPVTGTHFTLGLNVHDGMIIAMEKRVPRFAAQNMGVPSDKLPRLQRSSDIEWGLFKFYHDAFGSTDYKNLKYYMVAAITEQGTQAIIRKALENAHTDLFGWPGKDFSMEEDEGKAILGSSLAFPIEYLLMEHKHDLGGNMYVSKVPVFHSSAIT